MRALHVRVQVAWDRLRRTLNFLNGLLQREPVESLARIGSPGALLDGTGTVNGDYHRFVQGIFPKMSCLRAKCTIDYAEHDYWMFFCCFSSHPTTATPPQMPHLPSAQYPPLRWSATGGANRTGMLDLQ